MNDFNSCSAYERNRHFINYRFNYLISITRNRTEFCSTYPE